MKTFIKKQPPGRLIAMGFAMVILIGTCLLLTPWSVRQGVTVKPVDALFSATSAVCVTGLVTIDTADHFTAFGQAIMGLLIQIGGLGVSSVGVGLVIAAGKKVSFKSRTMAKEALNVDNYKGVVKLVKAVFCMTLGFELAGALLSFLVFSRDYPFLHAVGISVFHSVASFNNAGLDILGGLQNLIPYGDDVFLNIVTSALVIVGGIGFPVILDVARNRSFKKLTLHSKVVLVTSGGLLLSGTLLLKLTDHLTWMQAFFHSMSARTAGFSTCSLGALSNAGLFVIMILMFIGASSGSGAFHRSIPRENVFRAGMLVITSMVLVCIGTFLMCVLAPQFDFVQIMFEVVSAFSTAGLSTGITPELGFAAKVVLILIMFTGRLGVMTMVTIWVTRPERQTRYTEESVMIG